MKKHTYNQRTLDNSLDQAAGHQRQSAASIQTRQSCVSSVGPPVTPVVPGGGALAMLSLSPATRQPTLHSPHSRGAAFPPTITRTTGTDAALYLFRRQDFPQGAHGQTGRTATLHPGSELRHQMSPASVASTHRSRPVLSSPPPRPLSATTVDGPNGMPLSESHGIGHCYHRCLSSGEEPPHRHRNHRNYAGCFLRSTFHRPRPRPALAEPSHSPFPLRSLPSASPTPQLCP